MPWSLMPVQAGYELATLNDLSNLTFSSSVEVSNPFDHNLSQPLIHTPPFTSPSLLSPLGHTGSLTIYDTSLFPHDFPCVTNVYQIGQRSSPPGSLHPIFSTHFLWDMLISLLAFIQFYYKSVFPTQLYTPWGWVCVLRHYCTSCAWPNIWQSRL